MRLGRLLAGRTRKVVAAIVVLVIVAAIVMVARPSRNTASTVRTENETISVPGGPGVSGNVEIDATLYLPAASGPAPAVIMAHGFGGSKQSVAGDARDLAGHGFVVLAYSARGFGASTGQIALDSLDYEVPDARALVTWLSQRPEVLQDGPGDPRVGVTGASYGGALSLMLAGTDKRVDAVAPLITWNDLSAALFPNAIDSAGSPGATPADVTPATNGVFKKAWAASLMASVISGSALTGGTTGTAPTDSGDSGFGRGSGAATTAPTPGAAADPGSAAPTTRASNTAAASTPTASISAANTTTPVAGCGRMMLNLCAAYSQAAQTGREPASLTALLANSSPKAVVGKITAPTLLVQGERDTLFGLDQSDANARAIAANGTTVALTWYNGGHDGGSPDQVTRDRVTNWFTFYLGHSGAKPATSFNYSVDGPLSDTGRARTRTLQVPVYPGLAGAAPTVNSTVSLAGVTQTVLNPPGGSPAGISSLPGLSGLAGTALANFAGGLPGQVARFTSTPMPALTVIAGTPRISVDIAAVAQRATAAGGGSGSAGVSAPGSADGAVLFASMSKVSAGGTRALAGNAVAPIRVTGLPTDGTPKTVRIDLPAVAFQVEAGSHLEVDLATTDQAYAGPTSPAVYQISLTGAGSTAIGKNALSLPEVGGVRVSAGEVPVGKLVALIVLFVVAVLALILMGRERRLRLPVGLPSPLNVPSPLDPPSSPELAAVGNGAAPASRNGAIVPLLTSPAPLEISGLGKRYPGGVAAVTDVSFTVQTGQVLGLLGPNGAGKTTTLRMVMGLITPTSGEIKVFGQVIRPGADILSRIGSFVEGSGFLPHLSGRANLDLYWRASGRPMADSHMEEALEIAALGKAINRRVKTYSQGMRQRLAIAQSMLGLPDLLLLDEPTNGLDPPQIHAMREVLRGYAATGRTVLISSHMLSEVEQTCSHVVVVHQGRTIAAGTVAEMVAASGDMVFSVDSEAHAIDVLRSLPGVGEVSRDDPDMTDDRDLMYDPEMADHAGAAAASDESSGERAAIDPAATAPGRGRVTTGVRRAGLVRADLREVPAAVAVAALVNAGIAVTAASPRNRLEDVFLELVGAAGPTSASGGAR